jgi:hypothetical protein
MKITQVVPISETGQIDENGEEYDNFLCFLYDDNFPLVNTFALHKAQLTDGDSFWYHTKTPSAEARLSLSYDLTKLILDRKVHVRIQIQITLHRAHNSSKLSSLPLSMWERGCTRAYRGRRSWSRAGAVE